jgi:hypothetical protein
MVSWWTQQSSEWFGLLGLSGLLVPLLVWQAKHGRHREGVMRVWIGVIVTYSVITVAGVIAMLSAQPEHVWKPLIYAGLFTTVPYAALYRVISNAYVRSELRRTLVRDM